MHVVDGDNSEALSMQFGDVPMLPCQLADNVASCVVVKQINIAALQKAAFTDLHHESWNPVPVFSLHLLGLQQLIRRGFDFLRKHNRSCLLQDFLALKGRQKILQRVQMLTQKL